MINLEYSTAGTPTSTVSGSASASPSPTGTKSQSTLCIDCKIMLEVQGLVSNVSFTNFYTDQCFRRSGAITAPGPSRQLKNGIEQINPKNYKSNDIST